MSTRERWIIYPLLFMTLGIAMRDKVAPPTRLGNLAAQIEARDVISQRIRCGELQVGRVVVCNRVNVDSGPNEPPAVILGTDNITHAGIIETFNAKGIPQVRLFSTETGGIVSTVGRPGKGVLVMGDIGPATGLFAQVPGVPSPICLTPLWRPETKPITPQPPHEQGGATPPAAEPTEKTEKTPQKDPT